MNLLDKFETITAVLEELSRDGTDPTQVVIDEIISPTRAMIEGRSTILAGTNNYLGLTFDADCIQAGKDALEQQGTGTTGSRMANGTYAAHVALESELADFYTMPYAMVFSTGYAANLGTLCALLEPGDAVLLDADAHASLYDGCQMSGADVYRFKHNDVDSLEKRLRRLGRRAKRCLVITEGMYSVLGDCAPIRRIVELKEKYGALLLIDEAHSLGVFGDNGCGLAEELGLLERVDFVVGTFSKSLGATGGFCVSAHQALQRFCYRSRPYIFTASPSPSVIATTRAALRHLRAHPQLRQQLWANAERLYQGLSGLGIPLGPETSPVVAVRMCGREQALVIWRGLLGLGVYTNLILPPASPEGGSFLRCSMTAAHTAAQIDEIIAAFKSLKTQGAWN